jgi:ribonucleoside-diphosphate reductase alpha chain
LDWKGLVKKIKKDGLRHSHNSLIAPTGSIARIANEASFGIEPVFAFSYDSNILDGKKQTFNHPLYQAFLDKKLDVPKETFVCAKDIKWEDHIKMVAAWQKFVHNGISKTINMPKSATVDDVLNAYMMAYDLGLKGITIYREGSREKEVLVSSDADKSDKKPGRRLKEIDQKLLTKLITEKKMSAAELSDLFDCSISTIRKRVKELGLITKLVPEKIKCPDELDAKRYKVETPAGPLYMEVGRDADTMYPIETILNISKSGSSINAVAEALGKMVSKALQHRMDPYEVIDTLKNIGGGDSITWWRGKSIKSIPDALAKVLDVYIKEHVINKEELTKEQKEQTELSSEETCPVCGEKRIVQEGCSSCGCGSKCG